MNTFCEVMGQEVAKGGPSPLLVHADIFRARAAIIPTTSPQEMLQSHMAALEAIACERALWLPAFNYDFTRIGLYQPATDVSQVGPLTEYARKHWAKWRHGPPVFNFVGASEAPLGVKESGDVEPFGNDSLFAALHRSGGDILMYGADFSSLTAIHYIERLSGGPLYRYDKLFHGVVREEGEKDVEVNLTYHCRPLGKYLQYDFAKLRQEAESEGLVSVINYSGSEALYIQFAGLCTFWTEMLSKDPLYLLDAKSKIWVTPMLERLGCRFVVSDFE